MKAKWMTLLAGAMVLTSVPFTGYQLVGAAPPTGEVKVIGTMFGQEIPIPYLDGGLSLDWMNLLYDSLVGTTPEGKFSPELGLAHKWDMSPDGLTWTFYLRKGVKFHDGTEVTAKDVKFSIEQHMLPEAMNVFQSGFFRKNIKGIDVKDPYTIVIQAKQPVIFLINLLSNLDSTTGMIVPKDYYERVGKDEFQKHPVGSGPYRFHSQQVGSFIKLEATEKHWRDGIPKYKYMTYSIIPEEITRLAMLKTGEADISRISRESVKDAMSAGLSVINKENAAVVYFRFQMQWTSPIFSDIRFRKALNLAIDKEAIIKHIFAGLAKPIAAYPGSNISAVGGDLTLQPYPYDPLEARRLIKEGGWEGHEFTFISYPRPGCPEFPLVVEALAGYWQKMGLKPKIRMTEFEIFRKAWAERKTENTVAGADDSTSPDVPTLLSKFEDKLYFNNPRSSVNIPELDARFGRIYKSTDIAEISKLIAEIYRYSYDRYLMIPICEFPDKIATTKRIPNWDPGLRRMDRNYYDLIRQR